MFQILIIEKNNNCSEHFGCFFLTLPLDRQRYVRINVKAFKKNAQAFNGKRLRIGSDYSILLVVISSFFIQR